MTDEAKDKEFDLQTSIKSKRTQVENLATEKCELEKYSSEFEEELFRAKKDLSDFEDALPQDASVISGFSDALDTLQSDGVKMIEQVAAPISEITNQSFQLEEDIDTLEREYKKTEKDDED